MLQSNFVHSTSFFSFTCAIDNRRMSCIQIYIVLLSIAASSFFFKPSNYLHFFLSHFFFNCLVYDEFLFLLFSFIVHFFFFSFLTIITTIFWPSVYSSLDISRTNMCTIRLTCFSFLFSFLFHLLNKRKIVKIQVFVRQQLFPCVSKWSVQLFHVELSSSRAYFLNTIDRYAPYYRDWIHDNYSDCPIASDRDRYACVYNPCQFETVLEPYIDAV
jgi:hypothetical protein